MHPDRVQFLALANAWLRTDTQEIDPGKVDALRRISGEAGSAAESKAFEARMGLAPGRAAEMARQLLTIDFAASIEASEAAARSFKDYLPDQGRNQNDLSLYKARPSNAGRGYYAQEERRRCEAGIFPMDSMALLQGSFRIHRAAVEKEPIGASSGPQLALKDPSGRILLFEAIAKDRVRVTLGKRADFAGSEVGSHKVSESREVSGAFAAELLPWVRAAVDRGPAISGAQQVLDALGRTVSFDSGQSYSWVAEGRPDRERFERGMATLKPDQASGDELWHAYAAGWNAPPAAEYPPFHDEPQHPLYQALREKAAFLDTSDAQQAETNTTGRFVLWMMQREDPQTLEQALLQERGIFAEARTRELLAAFKLGCASNPTTSP